MKTFCNGTLSNKYYLEKELCNNGYKGVVYLAHDNDDRKMAIKTVASYLANTPYSLNEEQKIHNELNHKNIIKCLDYMIESNLSNKFFGDKSVMYLSTEYAENGDLLGLMQKISKDPKSIGLPFKIIRTWFLQILSALRLIHEQGYCHRDIKLDNILLSNEYLIKVADFGCSVSMNANENGKNGLSSVKGTENYMAPEIWENDLHKEKKIYNGEKIDIFSLGVVLFSMVFNGHPFNKAISRDQLYKFIHINCWEEFWNKFQEKIKVIVDKEGSEDEWNLLKDLIEKMLNKDSEKRIGLQEILKHKWINGEVYKDEEMINVVQDLIKERVSDE